MKLHLDPITGINVISGHGPGFVAVNGEQFRNAIIVLTDTIINPWPTISPAPLPTARSLTTDDFAKLFELRPALVIFGSGAKFCFPDRRIMAAFAEVRIGFEVMDTPAACRTYNVLMGEGRRIAAALLIG